MPVMGLSTGMWIKAKSLAREAMMQGFEDAAVKSTAAIPVAKSLRLVSECDILQTAFPKRSRKTRVEISIKTS